MAEHVIQSAVFTLKELGRYLHRGSASIYRDLELGRMPAPIRIGGRPMWRRAEIDAWLEAGAPPRDEWEARRATAQKSKR
jgi:predicted DNA-binding transcriptional regulator AlpA